MWICCHACGYVDMVHLSNCMQMRVRSTTHTQSMAPLTSPLSWLTLARSWLSSVTGDVTSKRSVLQLVDCPVAALGRSLRFSYWTQRGRPRWHGEDDKCSCSRQGGFFLPRPANDMTRRSEQPLKTRRRIWKIHKTQIPSYYLFNVEAFFVPMDRNSTIVLAGSYAQLAHAAAFSMQWL